MKINRETFEEFVASETQILAQMTDLEVRAAFYEVDRLEADFEGEAGATAIVLCREVERMEDADRLACVDLHLHFIRVVAERKLAARDCGDRILAEWERRDLLAEETNQKT